MTSTKVALILGAGPNIGAHVAKAFLAKGYKVATASRSSSDDQKSDSELSLKVDLSKPETLTATFNKVKETFGQAPSVVVHNAASFHPNDPKDPLSSLDLEVVDKDTAINTTSVLKAAGLAVEGFKTLPEAEKKTFIFTGNILPLKPIPGMLIAGINKAATANMIMSAAKAYEKQGYRFYYTDERQKDGSPVYSKIDGAAAAVAYTYLAEIDRQEPWYYTFVKGAPEYVDLGAPKL